MTDSKIRRIIGVINDLLYNTQKEITNEDVFSTLAKQYDIDDNISDKIKKRYKDNLTDYFRGYYNGQIKKAWMVIREFLKENGQGELIENKIGRNKTFRYPDGLTVNPGVEILNKERKDVRNELMELLSNSADLLPSSWIANFSIQDDDKSDKIIQFDTTTLQNQDLIPELYHFIKEKKVISFDYKPFGKPAIKVTLSPHLLKEYNLRWFVFGITNKTKANKRPSLYALDRISGIITVTNEQYQNSLIDYGQYFKNIIGVTQKSDHIEEIVIQVDDFKALDYIKTKKFHPSQNISENIVTLNVIPNYELETRILEFADRIKIIKPDSFRNSIFKRAREAMEKQNF